jgi:cold shock CspA family protein
MIEEVTRGIPHVRLDIGIPGSELVVDRELPLDAPKREVAQAVRDAFDVARRQLREHRKRRRLDAKRREPPPHGRIVRLVTDATGRHGFLLTGEGRQVYFPEDAVRDTTYDELDEGMEVRFVEVGGREGPQASVVAPLTPEEVSGVPEGGPFDEGA